MKGSRVVLRIFEVILSITLFGSARGYAQVSYNTATLKGTVFDPARLPVPGADITVSNSDTSVFKTAKSGETGNYQVIELPPGPYRVSFEAPGFSSTVVDEIVLTVGQAVPYDVILVLGTINQEVKVTDQPPLIDLEQTQQANTVNQRQIDNLPNISRRFTDLIYTVPGVGNSNAPSVQDASIGTGFLASGFSIGGSNGRNNLMTIDGGENDYGSGAPRVRNVPLDSVQEFQVNRNAFAAEFGNTVGAAINVVSRSGSNKLHGSASLYFHSQATDSVDYFSKLINPGSEPFEQSVISGITLGGPLKRNKLFFFTAYEHQQLDFPTTQNFSGRAEFQPITSQANGYSGGVCPGQPAQVSQYCYLTQMANSGTPLAPLGAALLAHPIFGAPLANPILNALVLPNEGTFNGIISALGAVRGTPGYNTPRGRYNNWVSRIDYKPVANDRFMFRFSFMNERDSVAPQPPTSTFDHLTDYTLTTSWTHSFNSALVNILRVQMVPLDTAAANTPLPGGSEIDLQSSSSIILGNPFSLPYNATTKRFHFDDSVALYKNGHSIKFGGSYQPNHYKIFEELWFGGQWKFADGAIPLILLAPEEFQETLANYNVSLGYPYTGPSSTNLTAVQSFIAGAPISLLQANSNSNAQWASWDQHLGFYGQDTWKVSRKLTMNYGVRLDYDAPPAPIPHSTSISPRLGFAWDPMGGGKTVIRAGGGLYFAPVLFMVPFYLNILGTSGNYINQGALSAGFQSPPFPSVRKAWEIAGTKATVDNPNPALTPDDLASIGWAINPPGPTAFGSVFSTLDPNFKPEYSIHASLSIAQELTPTLSVEVGYNMYRRVHIQQVVEGNYEQSPCDVRFPGVYTTAIDPFLGPCYASKPGTTAGVPNELVFLNDVWSSNGSGIYHGLTLSLNKRFSHSFQFQTNYTFSRAEDNTTDFSDLSVPFRPDQLGKEWSVSSFNVTHNFVANAVYTSSFHGGGFWSKALTDISISPIVSAHSGIPFTLLVPGLGGIYGNGTIGRTSEARPWNEPRNEGRGDYFASLDVRVSKAFFLNSDKGVKLTLIAQAQNLLNRTNFAAVNNIMPADPNFILPNGGNLLSGPYDVKGFAPTSISQLGQPLAFTSAYPPRYISFGLQLGF